MEDDFTGVAAGVNNAIARSAQLLAVPLLPLLAGISGIDTVGGRVFSEGFQAAQRVNAGILLVSAVVAAVILRPGAVGGVGVREYSLAKAREID